MAMLMLEKMLLLRYAIPEQSCRNYKSRYFNSCYRKIEVYYREYIKDGAIVIDVGMHQDENNKLSGDVDYDDVLDKVSAITPYQVVWVL